MGEERAAPGLFGKLPSHGDFVMRRLPPDVRLCFDDWIQAALVRSRADLGETWLSTWLSSPLWRFVAGAGVVGSGAGAWAGVMMPSHDRVGRCFPLLLAAPVAGTPLLGDCLAPHGGWFARLEDMALSALEEGFSLDAFDAALAQAGAAATEQGAVADAGAGASAAQPAPLGVFGAADMPALAASAVDRGQSAWWTDGSPLVAPCLAACSGLPAPEGFAALLDGRWLQHGWTQGQAGDPDRRE